MSTLPADLAELLNAGPLDRTRIRALHLAPDVLAALRAELPVAVPRPPWHRAMTQTEVFIDEELPPGGWRAETPEEWRERLLALMAKHDQDEDYRQES